MQQLQETIPSAQLLAVSLVDARFGETKTLGERRRRANIIRLLLEEQDENVVRLMGHLVRAAQDDKAEEKSEARERAEEARVDANNKILEARCARLQGRVDALKFAYKVEVISCSVAEIKLDEKMADAERDRIWKSFEKHAEIVDGYKDYLQFRVLEDDDEPEEDISGGESKWDDNKYIEQLTEIMNAVVEDEEKPAEKKRKIE